MRRFYKQANYSWVLLITKLVYVLIFSVSPLFHHHEPKQEIHEETSFHSHILAEKINHDSHDENTQIDSSNLLLDHIQTCKSNFDNCFSCTAIFAAIIPPSNRLVYPKYIAISRKIFYERFYDPVNSSCFLFYSDTSPPIA